MWRLPSEHQTNQIWKVINMGLFWMVMPYPGKILWKKNQVATDHIGQESEGEQNALISASKRLIENYEDSMPQKINLKRIFPQLIERLMRSILKSMTQPWTCLIIALNHVTITHTILLPKHHLSYQMSPIIQEKPACTMEQSGIEFNVNTEKGTQSWKA